MSAEPLRIAVAGASGRMGHMLIEALRASDDCRLAGALDIASSPAIGNDAGAFLGVASGVPVTADLKAGLEHAQVLIDFTRPEGTLAHLKACRELGVNAVVGTTGFSDAQKAQVADAVSGKSAVLTLVDAKGGRFVVPASRVAYVEIGPQDSRKVGFGA